jgi:hypothetical protein
MTEKVVSLSGGLVLGMAFALFLSVSTTQSLTTPLHMEYPSMSGLIGLNDLQSFRSSSSSQASDTTPAVAVAPPSQEPERDRIIRIATVTETTDPVFQAPVHQENLIPKNTPADHASGNVSTLRQMHQQHSYIASASGSASYATVGQIARQGSNFTSIADNGQGTGETSGAGGGQPSVVDNKPQPTGSPAVAQNDPETGEGEEEGGGPAVASFVPRPPSPDFISNDNMSERVDPHSPGWHNQFQETEEGHHPEPHGPSEFQQGHRPEVD